MKSSHFLYISDICRTTSVSAVDDQTPDCYIAVHSNDTPSTQGPMAAIASYRQVSMGSATCTSRRYWKSPDHSDCWIV